MLRVALVLILVSLAAFAFTVSQIPQRAPQQPIEFNHKQHIDYFQDGRHRRAMLAMHEEFLGEVPEDIQQGLCIECHGELEEAIEDTPRIRHCAECHWVFFDRDWEGRAEQKPCMACHNTVGNSPWASIPNIGTCAACHLPALGDSPEEMRLHRYLEQDRIIHWARVYDYLPGDIVFSHEQHAELGRVSCRECHGYVSQAEKPLSLAIELSMEDCMACHETLEADNDCLACHK